MKRPVLIFTVWLGLGVVLALLSGTARGAEELKLIEAKFIMRGYCYAGSKMDTKAPGGFGPSDNMPKKLETAKFKAEEGKLSLIALTAETVPFVKDYRGFRLVLMNRTKAEMTFDASDSRLSIIQEAQDAQGKWQPIEYLPMSWCGNSRHRVFLPKGEYWEFVAPVHSGPMKTKLRFMLKQDQTTTIYSNEFEGSIDPQQFTTKQGHTPKGIMDPYFE
ncbi:MAG TPA: hypothetical protein VGH19_04510 [Verrucomicrobiae bacterium]